MIDKDMVIGDNKDEVLEAAYAYLYNDMYFGAEVPKILENQPKILQALGIEKRTDVHKG